MSLLLQSFEERAAELSAYLKFMELIERDSARLFLPNRRTWRVRQVDEKIPRILKASFFLLLYNLIEASIREGFLSVYKAMEADGCSVSDLTPALRELWIDTAFARVSGGSANRDSYRSVARTLVQGIADGVTARLDVRTLRISGNLDAARIRQLCNVHGVSHKTDRRAKGGERLRVVKDKRNALGHGDLTFGECGRDCSVSDLVEIKAESLRYLKAILRNIDRFNAKKTYRRDDALRLPTQVATLR